MRSRKIVQRLGFTLIELVMVVLLLSILAAVAIPNFQDMRTEARDSAAKAALGGVRSAIAIARAAIALQEDVNRPIYPTALEMQQNIYDASHPVLSAITTTANKRILDASGGIPINPWSLTTVPLVQQSSIVDCAGTRGSFDRPRPKPTSVGVTTPRPESSGLIPIEIRVRLLVVVKIIFENYRRN